VGSCGRILCCTSFLGDFEPVSIRMAKDQKLSLNPTKISGICGRLMCCLKYENGCYKSDDKEHCSRHKVQVGKKMTETSDESTNRADNVFSAKPDGRLQRNRKGEKPRGKSERV